MASWQKHPLRALLLILVFGAYCIYRAMQYSSAAAGEQTTIAHVHEYNVVLRANCFYHFTVDGIAYSGSDCARGIRSGYFDATVYCDPSRPSVNSLDEFGAASKRWYESAAWGIGPGCFIFGMVIWWGAYKKSRRGNGGSDAEETVPDPDTVDRELRESAGGSKPIDSLQIESDRSANDDRA